MICIQWLGIIFVFGFTLATHVRINKIEDFLQSRVIPTCLQTNNIEPCAKGVR